MSISYELPASWTAYDRDAVFGALADAKASILALTSMPVQRSWGEELQRIQLKREVAGTSRIEGASFTERELDVALRADARSLETRSQKQAAAAVATYRWIAELSPDRPVDVELVRDVHRRLVTDCDDDHCPPGVLRGPDQNVTFGAPRHRGVDGGEACRRALELLVEAARTTFATHDPLIQALALHYHFAAMHPFLDGNGRTARALEALMLQRIGLRDTLFIAMSNYYYEETTSYLEALREARAQHHDLTPFLVFALRGIERQCRLLFVEIRRHVQKALYRNTYTDLFGRLKSPRKRVMSDRHVQLLSLLLEHERMSLADLEKRSAHLYTVRNRWKALMRDLTYLVGLKAITAIRTPERTHDVEVNLDWPMQITETEFFRLAKELPKAKAFGFLSS